MSPSGELDPLPAVDWIADLVIVYDGDCPFCSRYTQMLRLRRAAGKLLLVNARQGGPHVDEVLRHGLDLDEGMAAYYGGRWIHGADCMHLLAMLSSRSGVLSRLVAWIFRSPRRARVLYPLLRAGRNATLRVLRRRPIQLRRDQRG